MPRYIVNDNCSYRWSAPAAAGGAAGHALLHAHLVPRCPHADLFDRVGRAWLERQVLPDDERLAVQRHVREFDRLGEDLAVLDRAIGEATVVSPSVRRLLTVTGIAVTVAPGLVAAIGDVRRFSNPQKLMSYFGLSTCVPDQPSSPRRCAASNSRRGSRSRKAIAADRPTPTTSRHYLSRKWRSPVAPRPPTNTPSLGGSLSRRRKCADASSRPGSDKAARRSFQPRLRSSPRGRPRLRL